MRSNRAAAGIVGALLAFSGAARADYSVEREGTVFRGNLWVSDGVAGVFSSNSSAGNLLKLGGDLHFGTDYQFILELAILDRLWSGETSLSSGPVTRSATDFGFGYFVIPDKLWVMYSLSIEDLSGDAVIGSVTDLAHELSVGYRFLAEGRFNLALEAAYLFAPQYSVATYDYMTSTPGTVSFPVASVWSLSLRAGYDLGGR